MHSLTATDLVAIVQGMPQPYLILDADLVIVGASNSYLALTDRTLDDIVGRSILEAFPENPEAAGTVEQGPLEVSLRHVLATGKPHEMAVIQYDIPQPGGGFVQKFWTPIHTPVAGAGGKPAFIIQNPMDVTESVLKAREADARLRIALHAADLASWEYEPETDLWRRSGAVDVMFGFEPGEGGPVAAPFFAKMHPEDLGRVRETVASAIASPDHTVINFDYRIVDSGTVRHVSSRGEVLRTSTGKVRMIGVLMDVTPDREREAALSSALDEKSELVAQKDLLLAEVNHRVKNSLQLVVSTLRLQARRLEDPALAQAFDRAISRVRAIISVHEGLYRDQNSLAVNMAEHLDKLCRDITVAGGAEIDLAIDDISLTTERAIPVSVIVSELIHDLRNHRTGGGRVQVALKRRSPSECVLSVHGDEVASSSSELSQRLIASMASQIDGTILHPEDQGFWAVTFPAEAR
ncbi:sensor histidine kinase [Agrobacterium larrymoorei]|uniref:histidine kinase n=1 Tax=Agrobacterium larrymoorei TaxID=160699 RepID=A0A4D7E307_9HYPH|nr:histidine kinase dimerization/phosphoacceptor domain -containing protein [Agrobacterium larrymoorei]QCJ00577.1 PAS domain-containing protein [Agrobacterium larrymoorei]QYA10572.1 PAS domain-containing protein [Agrobacterium larrymoorei]